jgi:FtsH-binding integral membrane protein
LQTKFDLTLLTGMITIGLHLMIALIVLFVMWPSKYVIILVASAVILLISVFIIYDT